jgi:predicted DsbA family dithiol-disulfide isomerase
MTGAPGWGVETLSGQADLRFASAVPALILGGRYMLSGAQPPEVWGRVIGGLEHLAVTSSSD